MAFVAVALLCALVVGNSITLASGSCRTLAAEVRAAVTGESPSSSPSSDSTPDSRDRDSSVKTVRLIFSPGPGPFGPPTVSNPGGTANSSADGRPGVVVNPGRDVGGSTEEEGGSETPSDPPSPVPSNEPSSTPSNSPEPEPAATPEPSDDVTPAPPEDSTEVPESDSVLTFDDITNPDPPVDPDPDDQGDASETGSIEDDSASNSLDGTATQEAEQAE